MSNKIVILGGAGDMGWIAANKLLQLKPDLDIVLADKNFALAKTYAQQLGSRCTAQHVDLYQPEQLKNLIQTPITDKKRP